MASKIRSYQQLIIFLLFLIEVSSSSSSRSLLERHQTDYDNWLSWNIKNHKMVMMKRKRTSSASSLASIKLDRTHATSSSGTDNQVDEKLRKAESNKVTISVGQDGSSDFATINEALNAIPNRNTRRVVLAIKPGIYREKIIIRRNLPFVTFYGSEANDQPVITGNDTASATGNDGKPLRTFQSATVAVEANYFIAVNVRFENTAPHEVGSKKGQAVALRISGTKASFYNCSFYGTQDTLYDHKGLHYFNNCLIQGSVDFIFGYGRSFYDNCHLNSTATKVAFLTAQKRTSRSMESGFSFKDSVVSGSGHLYLGRAWGDYSRVVFSYTFMDDIVLPQGWSDWGDQKRDLKVYYGEYKCSGPGSNLAGRVKWTRMLSDEEAQPFLGTYYVEGDSWLVTP